LACRHCRAEAAPKPATGELDHAEAESLVRQIAAWKPAPILILSGGEPLMRPDVFDLASLARDLAVPAVLSTNGTLLDRSVCSEIKRTGIRRLSLSLDGPDPASHDAFRGVPGSYAALEDAAGLLRAEGIPFQINSTVTPENLRRAEDLLAATRALGACAFHVFLLVPVGRAKDWDEAFPAPAVYEAALRRLKALEPAMELEFKATCAPQYRRIGLETGASSPRSGKGCLGGQGFMFVGHNGVCGACGYLPLPAGNLREQGIAEVYRDSPLFLALRDKGRYRGKCSVCEYWAVCGGCRARAHAQGDFLGSEPLCPHLPKALAGPGRETACSSAASGRGTPLMESSPKQGQAAGRGQV
jgi:radical SAM protein with 4Fe4S-binding SPASM domain